MGKLVVVNEQVGCGEWDRMGKLVVVMGKFVVVNGKVGSGEWAKLVVLNGKVGSGGGETW
jgi:hypothetical protein